MKTPRKIRALLDLGVALLLTVGYLMLLLNQLGEGTFVANQHFAYLTNQIGYLTIAVLAFGAASRWRKLQDSPVYTVLRSWFVVYGFIVSLVYNSLLRGPDHFSFQNEITHVVAPIYLVCDWLYRSERPAIRWNTIWLGSAYPIAWTVFTLIRGEHTGWYPYFFLNPGETMGWWGVMTYISTITLLFLAVSAVSLRINNSRQTG